MPGLRQLSITERLETEREHLTKRLQDIDNALAALKAQPEVQTILDMLRSMGY